MGGLREALTAAVELNTATLDNGARVHVLPEAVLLDILAAHPAEPAPVVSREALIKTIDEAGCLKVNGTLWSLDRKNVGEIADAVLALLA